jgi:hypothetical protein
MRHARAALTTAVAAFLGFHGAVGGAFTPAGLPTASAFGQRCWGHRYETPGNGRKLLSPPSSELRVVGSPAHGGELLFAGRRVVPGDDADGFEQLVKLVAHNLLVDSQAGGPPLAADGGTTDASLQSGQVLVHSASASCTCARAGEAERDQANSPPPHSCSGAGGGHHTHASHAGQCSDNAPPPWHVNRERQRGVPPLAANQMPAVRVT